MHIAEYFFACFVHIFCIFDSYSLHLCIFFIFNCIFSAYFSIFLPDPFQLALFLAVPQFLYHSRKPNNNRVICTLNYLQAHADSPGYGDPGAPPGPAHRPTGQPPCTPTEQQQPPLRLRRISFAPAAGQSSNIGRIYIHVYTCICNICNISTNMQNMNYMQYINDMPYYANI